MAQALVQEPQCVGSLARFTHPFEPQSTRPEPGAQVHKPALHVPPGPQLTPQAPQLAGSVCTSTQAEPHWVRLHGGESTGASNDMPAPPPAPPPPAPPVDAGVVSSPHPATSIAIENARAHLFMHTSRQMHRELCNRGTTGVETCAPRQNRAFLCGRRRARHAGIRSPEYVAQVAQCSELARSEYPTRRCRGRRWRCAGLGCPRSPGAAAS